MRAIVVGYSHIVALQSAPLRSGLEIYRIIRKKNGKAMGDMSFADILHLVVSDPASVVISAMGGNEHQMYLLEHSFPFDFIEPGNDSLEAGHEMIPYAEMYDVFEDISGQRWKQIAELHKAANRRTFHLEVPPPKESEAHIRKRVESLFRDGINAGKPITRATIRAKLWRLQRRVAMDCCQKIGMMYVPAPVKAKTANDFLRPEFYAADATHANARYGALVLDQIEALY
jgi:hypothetical protein